MRELEISLRHRVEDQVVRFFQAANPRDMGQLAALRFFQILQRGAGRADRERFRLEAEAFERQRRELSQQEAPARFVLETPVVALRRDGGVAFRPPLGEDVVGKGFAFGIEDLARAVGRDRLRDFFPPLLTFELEGDEVSSGKIGERSAQSTLGRGDRHEIARLFGFEIAVVQIGRGGDDTDDLAANDALGFLGILDLVADGDFEAAADEPAHIGIGGVVGDTAHRDRGAGGVFLPGGERKLEGARGFEGVVVEHLVEIAHAEKEDGVLGLRFDLVELPHRGRGRFCGFLRGSARRGCHGRAHCTAGRKRR